MFSQGTPGKDGMPGFRGDKGDVGITGMRGIKVCTSVCVCSVMHLFVYVAGVCVCHCI